MRRCVPSFGLTGLLLVAGCGPMHFHLWGRYDHRTGTVQERPQGGDLLNDLLDEAARAAMEVDVDKTSEK